MRIYVLLLYVFPTIVRSIFSFFPWPPATVAVPSSSSSSSRSPRILHSTVQRLTRNRTDCIVCAGIFFFFLKRDIIVVKIRISSMFYVFRPLVGSRAATTTSVCPRAYDPHTTGEKSRSARRTFAGFSIFYLFFFFIRKLPSDHYRRFNAIKPARYDRAYGSGYYVHAALWRS